MRRFLLCAGMDGQERTIDHVASLVEQRKPEIVLFAGGLTAPGDKGQGESRHRLKLCERFFQAICKPGVLAVAIPGPDDVPLREFLHLGMQSEVGESGFHMVHATLVERNDIAYCGLGGEFTESTDSSEPRVQHARATAQYYLRALWKSDQSRKVLLLGVPPTGSLGGELGNGIAGEFIESFHPHLAVVGGATAYKGTYRLAHSLVVNPGRLSDGSAAWLDWSQAEHDQVQMLEIPALRAA